MVISILQINLHKNKHSMTYTQIIKLLNKNYHIKFQNFVSKQKKIIKVKMKFL